MKYHKIPSIYKRDKETNKLLVGQYTYPYLEYLKDNTWEFSEKINGTNIRVIWDGVKPEFKGRTDNAQIPTTLFQRLVELFMVPEKIELLKGVFNIESDGQFEQPVTLVGEGYGAKIQKGGGNYKPDGVDFALFDVHIGMWLERFNVEDIAQKLNVGVAPIIGEGTLADAERMVREGFKSQWGDFNAEGIVARPKVEMLTRRGDRIITKIKTKDF